MKKAFLRRTLSLVLGLLLLFSLTLTAAGAGMDALLSEWKQDQVYTLAGPAPWNLDELKQVVDVRDPRSVAAYWVWAVNRLVDDYDDGMEMLKYLFADLAPYGSGYTEGGLYGGWTGDYLRLDDPDYCWLPRTFFEGANAANGFALSQPLSIELYYNGPNTENINQQSDDMGLGRSCIVYWIQSYAGGNQVNINLMKFSGSDRWYVTSGGSSAALFYDQRSPLTPQEVERAASTRGDVTTAEEHNAFYHSGVTDPVNGPGEITGPVNGPGVANFKAVNTYAEGQFTDVASNFWGVANIAKAYELDLMKGTGDGFDPNGNVTIAQAITMAARLNSIYETGSADFVQGSPWYQVYEDYLFEHDLLIEYFSSDDYNRPATRRQFAALLAWALPTEALPEISSIGYNAIPDVQDWEYHANAIYRLYKAGILTGNDEKGTFTPEANISRAAAAAILTRMADPSLRVSITLK